MIDSDEFIMSFNSRNVVRLIQKYPNYVARININNEFTRNHMQLYNTEWINRVYSKQEYSYEGRIHEQLVAKDSSCYDTYELPISIKHSEYEWGYLAT